MNRVSEVIKNDGAILRYAATSVGAFPGLKLGMDFRRLARSLSSSETKESSNKWESRRNLDCLL
jgi:hypothetical protein